MTLENNMIRLFGQTDKVFTSNGDVVLKPLKAKVHKEDNGDYYLDLETTFEYLDYLVEGNIVVANTPTGDQAFRVGNVNKTKNKIETRCWHVFYDSERYLIADSYVVDKNCDEALKHLNNATEPQTEFEVYSDIATIDSYRCVRKSFYEAIKEVINRWGGHLVRNNFVIGVQASTGQDRGITIQYKKNLKDIVCTENWDAVVTKILPVGQDGILLNAVNPSASIYLESSTQYDIPYTRVIEFSQDISQDDYPNETAYKTACVNDLTAQATAYLAKNCVPQVNYTLKADLDRVTDIGDTIEVIDERLGVNLLTKVVSFEYDCILNQYTEVEFGNLTQKLSDLVSNVSNEASDKAQQAVMQTIDGQFTPCSPTFTEATTRANIQSAERYDVILGKIEKYFSDLKDIAFLGSCPVSYGNCDDQANEQIKEITCDGFTLSTGAIIAVEFDADNTYSATSEHPIKFNVNDTEDVEVRQDLSTVPTGTQTDLFGQENRVILYVYNGTYFIKPS